MMLHHHDAAIGKSRAQLQVQGSFRPEGQRAHEHHGIHVLRRHACQGQTRGHGLFGQFRGSVRARLQSLPAQLRFFDGRRQTTIAQDGASRVAQNAADPKNDHFAFGPPCCAFSIFAHVSRNATVRLKTSFPGVESGSTQKYPSRSN